MRHGWWAWICVGVAGCGTAAGGNGGTGIPVGGSAGQAAQIQLALVPAEAVAVAQAQVGRLFRRSETRAGEQLLQRLVDAEEHGADVTCVFDLAETVGWATLFYVDREGGADGGALLLETDAEPGAIVDCLRRASNGELAPTRAPPELSDTIVVGDPGELFAVFAREDGTVVVADARTAMALLGPAPERTLGDDPFYRELAARVGPGDATFAWIEREERWRDDDEPHGPTGVAGALRAGTNPPEARVVLVSPDSEEIGDVVEEFQEGRAEVRKGLEELLGSLDRVPPEAGLDRDRTSRTFDLVLQLVGRLRVVVEENAATFELALPDGTDLPAFLADLGYSAIAWLALEN